MALVRLPPDCTSSLALPTLIVPPVRSEPLVNCTEPEPTRSSVLPPSVNGVGWDWALNRTE